MTSFYLVPEDRQALPPFLPGQYLSIKVHPEGYPFDQIRQYSLSSASNGHYYRISVQRESAPTDKVDVPEGLVSNFLNDSVSVGDMLSVHMPGGDFILKEGNTTVVLLSGGAGATAMLCMLEHLASPAGGSRDVLFMHATRARAPRLQRTSSRAGR
jgi:nitric oxide dioxygenase